ncbi:MAG TPA: nucleotide exchange factor GrpE [Candidatus Paceibacterota bacterium]|nr:nucleotide exchange factor GrpE [Candidatus Paceibacterota bacterium]
MDERDDIEVAPDEDSGAEEAGAKAAKLRDELKACRAEKQEYMDGWQRAKADYVNALKRFEEDKKKERERGVLTAAEALLPAFDAIERAKAHGDVPEGFAAIVKQLESAFASLGLAAVGKEGEAFDPALHEAYGQDAVEDEKKDGIVTAVLEPGWKMGETLVRPAKVRVGQFAR